mmetsp:Transcript_17159/g.52784  ORF Transcript_17159/g.52784 Transcript_17159/m.52784 type:complete len:552 (+) Transcript_17159:1253-2908(+)
MKGDAFVAYARLWAATELLLLHHDQFLIPHAYYAYAVAVGCAAAFVAPGPRTLGAAMVARVVMYAVQAPAVWDSCYWVNIVDVLFLFHLAAGPADVRAAASTRLHMGLFYVGAGFWKLNTAFLDPARSCAGIFVVSLLAMLPCDVPDAVLVAATRAAPALTVGGELALGVCVLAPGRAARRVGVALACALHFMIAITPYPNQVPAFGVVCVARLFFVMPGAWTAALTEAVAAPTTLVGALYRAVAVAAAAASALTTSTPGISIDYAIPASTLLSFVGARAIALDAAADAPSRNDGLDDDEEDDDGPPPSALARRGDAAFLALTLFYVFLAQPLGVVDVSGVSPFSGIRAHGGSNHLFMPTALLQRWKADEEGGDWGGGVVRVTSSTSTFLNDLYPGECTEELPPRAIELLKRGGHVAVEYNPTARVMLGPEIRATLPRAFVPYTLPAHELRRVLGEVRAAGEPFELAYDRLPGAVGDEAWRRTATASSVYLSDDGRGGRSCRRRAADAYLWEACAEDEVGLLPPPSGLLAKVRIFFPYPIHPGVEGLPCMD